MIAAEICLISFKIFSTKSISYAIQICVQLCSRNHISGRILLSNVLSMVFHWWAPLRPRHRYETIAGLTRLSRRGTGNAYSSQSPVWHDHQSRPSQYDVFLHGRASGPACCLRHHGLSATVRRMRQHVYKTIIVERKDNSYAWWSSHWSVFCFNNDGLLYVLSHSSYILRLKRLPTDF